MEILIMVKVQKYIKAIKAIKIGQKAVNQHLEIKEIMLIYLKILNKMIL
jgi:hypothetical protein